MISGLLQDWTTVVGVSDVLTVQSMDEWIDLSNMSDVTFWLDVMDVTTDQGGPVTLTYQSSPSIDEGFFLPLASVSISASSTPVVTRLRLSRDPTIALGKFLRWTLTGVSPNWSATIRISYSARMGLEGPPGMPSGTSGFRLSLTSGTPVTTTDTTGSTLYLTPYQHSQILLYDGTSWNVYSTAEISLSPSVSASTNYDVFAYYDAPSDTVKLEMSNAWTNNTTRADAVSRVNGVLVKSANATRRLVGTVRGIATGLSDTAKQRFVWNAQNQVSRFLSVTESSANWTDATASYREAANTSGVNIFEYISGDVDPLHANVHVIGEGSLANLVTTVGVGIDSSTVNSGQFFGKGTEFGAAGSDATTTEYRGYTAAGYHKITWLEYAGTTLTYFSKNGSPAWATSGMNGTIKA